MYDVSRLGFPRTSEADVVVYNATGTACGWARRWQQAAEWLLLGLIVLLFFFFFFFFGGGGGSGSSGWLPYDVLQAYLGFRLLPLRCLMGEGRLPCF